VRRFQAITLQYLPGLAVGVLLVESQLDSRSSIAGAVTLAIGIESEFSRRNAAAMLAKIVWE
jgi:hypothetical protein